jgi:hypothetical protein
MAQSMALWFRKTYRLAPTDPRYLQATPEQIEAEYWAYHFSEKGNSSEEEYEDEDFSVEEEMERIRLAAEAREALESASRVGVNDPGDWEEVILD